MTKSCLPSSIGFMSDPDIAWVAGILEGEGSFMCWTTTRGTETVRIQMGTTDLDVLERLRDVVGTGRITPVKHQLNKLGTKPIWIWMISRKSDVVDLASKVYPLMGARRKGQIEKIFAHTEGINIQQRGVCMNGHAIAGGNRLPHGACRQCATARRRVLSQARRAKSDTGQ